VIRRDDCEPTPYRAPIRAATVMERCLDGDHLRRSRSPWGSQSWLQPPFSRLFCPRNRLKNTPRFPIHFFLWSVQNALWPPADR
jgi:hypothetical protein